MKRMIPCLTMFAATAAAFAANTWYVDDDNYAESYVTAADYIAAGFDGTTKEKAFGTIQMAVDKSASGDTILVCPGTYDKGVSNLVVTGTDCGACRIVAHKSVRVESTDGAAATHIVGAWDKTTETGRGPNAVRCIGHYWTKPVFVGFTIRDGATQDDGTGDAKGIHHGSAVYSWKDNQYATLVDCVISNCTSVYGTFQSGCIVRSLVCDNTSSTCIGRQTAFYSSIITRNIASGKWILYPYTTLAHCTVFGNIAYTAVLSATSATNNVIALSHTGGTELGAAAKSGNILGGTDGIYQLVGPAVGDFRVLAGSSADIARVAGVDGSGLAYPVPEEFRGKDFFGNPIPAENALPGAVQQVAAAAGGALQFDELSSTAGVIVDGWKSIKAGAYVFPTNYPVQYFVSPALSSGKLYAWTTSSDHGGFHMPDWKTDSMYLMPPPQTGVVMTNTLQLAKGEVWVDPTENGSDENGNGLFDTPYHTLQKGYSATKDYYFVYCKAGSYDEGGEECYGMNRIYTHDRSLRFVGVAGAANTFIVGEADPSNLVAAEPGCGPDACRCLYVGSGTTGFEGFTFQNGHASSSVDGSATSRQGGVLRTTSNNVTIQDCVVESSCSSASHAFTGGRLVRCHFKGLASGIPAYSLARLSGCLIENCPVSTWPGGMGFHCTLRNSGNLGNNYLCIASGNLTATAVGNSTHAGSLYWGFTTAVPSVTGYTVAKPRFVSPQGAEIRRISPAFTCGEVPTAANFGSEYYKHVCTDFFGNPIAFVDGKPVAGADQIGTAGIPGAVFMVK